MLYTHVFIFYIWCLVYTSNKLDAWAHLSMHANINMCFSIEILKVDIDLPFSLNGAYVGFT